MIEVESQLLIKKSGIGFLDPVNTRLLIEIKKSGSLNCAAKTMNISYQYAWKIINAMNSLAAEPMVLKQRGGARGGGAAITLFGEKMLRDYQSIQNQINKIVRQVNVEINL